MKDCSMIRHEIIEDIAFALQTFGMSHFLKLDDMQVISLHKDSEWYADDWEELEANPGNYITIDALPSYEVYNLIDNFAASVQEKEDALGSTLFEALDRKRPTARFKEVVFKHNLQQEWYEFAKAFYINKAKEWIESSGVSEL